MTFWSVHGHYSCQGRQYISQRDIAALRIASHGARFALSGGMNRRSLLALMLAASLGACALDPDIDQTSDAIARPPGSSYVTDAVLTTLDAAGNWDRTWNISSDNALVGSWLLQTPPAPHWGTGYGGLRMAKTCTSGASCDPDFQLVRCSADADCGASGRCAPVAASVKAPGQAPTRMCVGHSDLIVDEMYGVLTSTQQFADVTSLLPPDGRFEAALRNAITYLGNSGRPVTVRLLFGDFPVAGVVNSKTVLQRLTRDLPASAAVKVYVGNYRSSDLPPSWNHSKIVAADGREAIVGGHNLWSQHYLGIDPVHDLSMHLRGSAAGDAQRFANVQWKWTCDNRSWLTWTTWSVWANDWQRGAIGSACPPAYALPATSGGAPGTATVIAIGRLAYIDPANASNQSDLALAAMMRAARRTIRISQQDLGPPTAPILGIPVGTWPTAVFTELGAALARGVDVYIVLSNPGATAGGLSSTTASYSNGWTLDEVARRLRAQMIADAPAGAPTGAALDDLLCAHLHLAPLRFSAETAFPDGGAYPNHAKLVFVDDQAFYIGSQNLYNAGLTEFGFLVDDTAAAATLRADYWDPVWTQSSRAAVTGSEAARCALR
jgi:phosphatidylserine/phosphatidylglycerophosphate/cardiolipin synthase-like enzyme